MFRVIAQERKAIVQRIKELQPDLSNRQIARTLGVADMTVGRDLATNVAPADGDSKAIGSPGATNVAPGLTGREAAQAVDRREHSKPPSHARLHTMKFPPARYPLILADPPWRYENPPMGGAHAKEVVRRSGRTGNLSLIQNETDAIVPTWRLAQGCPKGRAPDQAHRGAAGARHPAARGSAHQDAPHGAGRPGRYHRAWRG